ncbi:sensor histidine kinase [Nocardioides zeae]|uniref:histidine kinase n=1 Tax=Nocardioides zeae TaxID=1457234 RepID=A0AAJ1TZJ9_9ACTN|nr:ATP-binding protein [Nocardioides zeae]MDQ1102975.1 PAS domain S-box-containing protein [Nocardioides zeae]
MSSTDVAGAARPEAGGLLAGTRLPALLLLAVLGLGFVAAYWGETWVVAFTQWPVGLVTAAAIVAPLRWAPVPVVLGGLAGWWTMSLVDVRPLTAVGFGVSVAVQALAATIVLRRRDRGRPGLRSQGDLGRWLVAGTLGPLLGVLTLAGFVGAAGVQPRTSQSVLVLLATTFSQLLLTLPFLRFDRTTQRVTDPERWAQWVAVLAATTAVFTLQDEVAWAFTLVPLLAWGALRLTLTDMIAQLFVITVTVLTFASIGVGPYSIALHERTAVPDTTVLLLFLLSAVLLVVPYTLVAQLFRARSAEAHRERELVGRIMDSATRTAIIGTDRDGRITVFNVGAELLLGYDARDMLGQTPAAFVPRSELRALAEAVGTAPEFHRIARALTKRSSEPRDWRMRRKSGEMRSHSVTITRMHDQRGEVVGYVCTSEDVTARVQRQDALLAALLSEREAVERLEQADRMKDALVSTVSHELRTPLTSVLGYATMLADGDLGEIPPLVAQTLERIINNGERLRSLVEDLLVLSRVNAGQLDLASEPLDLRDVVRSAYDVVAPQLETRDLEVRVALPDDEALVDGDAGMLERVVLNLLTNALKFTHDGGQVDVSLRLESDEVVIEVSDTGLGIPVDEQDQLFTQFFRSSIAKREAIQGTGLGLSIAHAIVEQHGGVIGATSEPSIGSTFLVVLPRLGVRAQQPA